MKAEIRYGGNVVTRPEKARQELTAFLRFMLGTIERMPPDVIPDGDDGVDIHWKAGGFEMLLNVPSTGTVSYYADDQGFSISVKGEIELP